MHRKQRAKEGVHAMGRIIGRNLAVAVSVVAVLAGLTATAQAAVTQTFTTAQSPFPADDVGGGGPNQGFVQHGGPGGFWFQRGAYQVTSGLGFEDNYFSFDLRSSCAASGVTLQLVRGSEAQRFPGEEPRFGGADYTIRELTTPADILNVPGGSPWSTPTWINNLRLISFDLHDGPTYGGGPYPLDGSPSDVLSFPLSAAGVVGFNAARGGFFSVGGSGGGRTFVTSSLGGATARDRIFAGVTDPAKLVVTCELPTSKEQCKNGGWKTYGVFKNQGDCVSFVATTGKNPPAGTTKP